MQDFINCEASICTIFNLDSSILESCSCIRRNEQTIIDVKLLDSRPACPECGNPITKIKGYVTKTIQHSLLADKKCVLQYHARRYICPICHKTFYEYNPFVFQNMKISSDLMLQILKDLQEPGETFTHAAKRYHISPTSVSSIFDSVVSIPRAKLPEIMCTDENYAFHSKTQNSKYICLLIDQTNGQPIDILPSRRYEYLDKYFSNIPKYEIDQVHIMITDMYEPYRRIIKKHFKNAIHVVDHYHVSQELHRRVDRVRLRIMNPLRCINTSKRTQEQEENYYLLKHKNGLLFKHFTRSKGADGKPLFDILRPKEYNKVLKRYMNPYDYANALVSIHPDINKAWELKDELTDFYVSNTLETAPAALKKVITDFRESNVEEMVKFSYTLANWQTEIINSFYIAKTEYKLSRKTGQITVGYKRLNNALMERLNGTVKLITKAANGYTNWERFRNRCMLVLEKGIEFAIDEKDKSVKMVEKKEPTT